MKKLLVIALACTGCGLTLASSVRYKLLSCSEPDSIKLQRIEAVETSSNVQDLGGAIGTGFGGHGAGAIGSSYQHGHSVTEHLSEMKVTLQEALDIGVDDDNDDILSEAMRKLSKINKLVDGTSAVNKTGARVASVRIGRKVGNVIYALVAACGAACAAWGIWGAPYRDGGLIGTGAAMMGGSALIAVLHNWLATGQYARYAQLVRRIVRMRNCRLDHPYLTEAYRDLETVLEPDDFAQIHQVPMPESQVAA